jgi:heme exporter protein CcmD
MSWRDILHMGGYGLYVWSAYALTVAAMGTEVFVLLRRRRAQRDAPEAPTHDPRAGASR